MVLPQNPVFITISSLFCHKKVSFRDLRHFSLIFTRFRAFYAHRVFHIPGTSEPFSFRFFLPLWLESRDLVAPTGVCRESEFPPTEELNASACHLSGAFYGKCVILFPTDSDVTTYFVRSRNATTVQPLSRR